MPTFHRPDREEIPFSKIKRRVAQTISDTFEFIEKCIPSCSNRMPDNFYEALKTVQEICLQRIRNWDVRCVSSMIDRFPSCVTRSWRISNISAFIDEQNRWIVAIEYANND